MMKRSILAIILVFFFYEIHAQTSIKLINRETTFKEGELVYLFGDKVRLKEKPSKASKEVDLLKIGSKVKILKKSSEKYWFNGRKWNWYKVKTNTMTGYVVGGLLSLDTKIIDNSMYLVSLKKDDKGDKIITRLLEKGKKYTENINVFDTKEHFTTEVFHNKGVNGIKNMFFINYKSEVLGVNQGGYYLFNQDGILKKAIDLRLVINESDSYVEKVIFPQDEEGIIGKILFSREIGGIVPNQKNKTRTRSTIESCEFVWKGKEMKLESMIE